MRCKRRPQPARMLLPAASFPTPTKLRAPMQAQKRAVKKAADCSGRLEVVGCAFFMVFLSFFFQSWPPSTLLALACGPCALEFSPRLAPPPPHPPTHCPQPSAPRPSGCSGLLAACGGVTAVAAGEGAHAASLAHPAGEGGVERVVPDSEEEEEEEASEGEENEVRWGS